MLSLALFCLMPSFLLYMVSGSISKASAKSEQKHYDSQIATGVSIYVTSYLDMATKAIGSAFPSTPTMAITSTPTSTPTPSFDSKAVRMVFELSFYDPAIGKIFPEAAEVNCLEWSWEKNDCLSKVNFGQDDYRIWYRRGFACPDPIQIGQQVKIISPPELRAISEYWTCIDRGGGIYGERLDFLLEYPGDIWTGSNLENFPWWSQVEVEILPNGHLPTPTRQIVSYP